MKYPVLIEFKYKLCKLVQTRDRQCLSRLKVFNSDSAYDNISHENLSQWPK